VNLLAPSADLFLRLATNSGYGRAVNAAVRQLAARGPIPQFLGALNTDLAWEPGSIKTLIDWMGTHPEVVLAVPRLLDPAGREQHLCKQHPTLLGLFSRRFVPERFKAAWLQRYDRWYVMADRDYGQVLDVPYLSGCCMLMRSSAFMNVGGFDERFFLYLEDADLTRAMARLGRTVHLPLASVVHHWGRGNHSSLWLTLVNLNSAWIYFSKWGWRCR
jgi:GT2 family glycosyltransferase